MAIIDLPITVTFSLVDETGSKSSMQLSVPNVTTLAAARTAATAMIPLVAAISQCSVTGYSFAATTVDTEAPAPEEKSRVERKGLFSARTAAGKIATVTVPGIDPAFVLPSGRIDDDAAPVAAFRAALFGAPWSDSNGSDLVTLEEAYEVSRKSTKRQLPSDRRVDVNAVAESEA